MNFYDTIAAVATAFGKAGIATIRISGSEALEVASRVFCPKNGKSLAEISANTAVYGEIYRIFENGKRECIDDGIAVVFRAPHSFTGEDTVELSCHGGVALTEFVLESVLAAGARAAEAGEFTRRAFVNGKMGLSKAEALGALLDASNYNQVLLSRGGMEGRVGKKCAALYEKLRSVAANIYAKIDFPDEDLSSLSREEFCEELRAVERDISGFASTYTTGRAVSEGVRTVICGSTNVGKSSLYNLFVGRDAAIVTDIEGTTRDTLEETVSVGRATLRLCDTAGLRDASDAVEKIGIERTKNALDKAELIIAVFDGTRSFSDNDNDFIKAIGECSAEKIAVINKADKEQKFDVSELSSTFNNIIYMSALTGDGFEKLCGAIENAFIDERINLSTDAIIANSRQHATLVRAGEHIAAALESFNAGYSEDVCCVDIEMAMADLGELDGKEVGDDIVAEIFSHFCVGK